METFPGFTEDSFDFFHELAANNNTAWFKANRHRYDQHIVGVFRGLLQTLQPFLLKLNPHFETGGKPIEVFPALTAISGSARTRVHTNRTIIFTFSIAAVTVATPAVSTWA